MSLVRLAQQTRGTGFRIRNVHSLLSPTTTATILRRFLVAGNLFLDLEAFAPLDQAPVVIHEDFRLRNNPPLHSPQELEFQQRKLLQTDPSHASVGVVSPETVAQSFAGDSGACDEEAMDGEGGNGEGGVEGAQSIDVIDHA